MLQVDLAAVQHLLSPFFGGNSFITTGSGGKIDFRDNKVE
jgi:hypothetical protein